MRYPSAVPRRSHGGPTAVPQRSYGSSLPGMAKTALEIRAELAAEVALERESADLPALRGAFAALDGKRGAGRRGTRARPSNGRRRRPSPPAPTS
jgi:hypothetical protein